MSRQLIVVGRNLLLLLFVATFVLAPVRAFADSTPLPAATLKNILMDETWYTPSTATSCSSSDSTGGGGAVPTGSSVYILGDSITVRTESVYDSLFQQKGITPYIDASVGRSWDGAGQAGQGVSKNGSLKPASQAIIDDQAAVKSAGGIVIALGSNGGLGGNPIKDVIDKVRSYNPTAPIWWVDLTGTSAWGSANLKSYMGPFNKALTNNASAENYKLIDWAGAVAPDGDPFTTPGSTPAIADPNGVLADGLHPNTKGSSILGNLVVGAVSSGGGSSGSSPAPAVSAACCDPGAANLQGSDNQQKAFNFFVGKGLTAVQSAAIIGNLMAESGVALDPEIKQGGGHITTPIPNVGFGIAQWTSPGRQQNLVDFAAKEGLPVTELSVQLGFYWQELTVSYKSVLSDLKASTDIGDAVYFILHDYESPKDKERGGDNWKLRTGYAKSVLKNYGASAVSASGDAGATSSDGCGDASSVGVGEGALTPSSLPPLPNSADMIKRAQAVAGDKNSSDYQNICANTKKGSCEGLCDHLAAGVWGESSSGYCTAIVHWQSLLHYSPAAVHPASSADGMSPPVGALLFYGNSSPGHVTAYLGNNMVVSNDVLGNGGVYITSFKNITDGKWHMTYLGWTLPIFGGPSWQNPIPCPPTNLKSVQ